MRTTLRGLIAPLVVGALLLALAPSARASIRFVTRWGSEGAGNGQFQRPYGVAADSQDDVYVVEYDGARVDKFTSSGTFLTKWGDSGSGNGQFTHPQDIAVGASDNVYVADTGNNRIEEFSSSGSFIRQWGGSGTGDGQFKDPTGIATDAAGNVYVADAGDERVQKFDSSGSFLATWLLGDGSSPTDIAIDSSGDMYVNGSFVDFHSSYSLIRKYDSSGNLLGKWSNSVWPVSLAFDPADRLFVAGEFQRMWEFGSSGTSITSWGGYGTGAGQFDRESGVAANSAGDIYVADAYNNRVQVFRQSTAVPDTSITDGPSGTSHDSTPTFSFSSQDLDASLACKLDSGPYKPCSSRGRLGSARRTFPPMADGPHTFRVRATDPNGTDPTPAVRSFTLRATDAATAGVSGSTLVVTAGSNALDHIRIGRRSGTTFGVSDAPKYESSGAQVVAGAHCTRSRPSAVICHAKKLTGIRVMSGDRGDLVENKTSIHSSILGGTGEDVLYGGGGDDSLTGGPGQDTLYGMSGDDLLLARDGHNDRVHCDAPFQRRPSVNTDRAVLDELPLDANVANCETVTRP